jgi:hypothetical protein
MAVDNNAGSPFQDRIYVSWTEFAANGSAFIYEAHSSDYGETFSSPVLVSRDSSLCPNTYGAGTSAVTGEMSGCNENQDSNPFVGSDGALYVAYNNFNNAETISGPDNRNQILLAKSTDGGATFGTPVKVSDYYDLPDCATYQGGADFGRLCVPEKGPTTNSIFRATNYPSGAVDPTDTSHVIVTFGSYINKNSQEPKCVPTGVNPATGGNRFTGVKTVGGCNNDILISVSTDGGSSFTGTTTDPRSETVVTQDARQATTDQFWQWAAFTKNGKLAVSYYDRQYGNDETTGASDFSLSGSGSLTTFSTSRATSSSMPPPTQFGGLFFGDYTGLAAQNQAIPIWMDTRPVDLFVCPGGGAPSLCQGTEGPPQDGLTANDQDIYATSMGVPGK